MEVKNIILTAGAIAVIKQLQHVNGTYTFYDETLARLFNFVLNQSDEIGMSDTEAINTLRALRYLREDLACIANKAHAPEPETAAEEETAGKVDSVFAELSVGNAPTETEDIHGQAKEGNDDK